ncbi:fumarylacetoacetate hydrolase family protein [bacterium]|nr:fumarylacetoacetate hydrolase family protein [bacterium]
MKYYTFAVATPLGTVSRIGAELDGRLVDLNSAAAFYFADRGEPDADDYADFLVPPDMVTYLSRGDKASEAVAAALSLVADAGDGSGGRRISYDFDEVSLMAPVPRPNIVWDSMVFVEHVKMGRPVIPDIFYENPPYFTQSGAIVAGPYDPIVRPRFTQELDFEFEFGIYIGKKGINIPASEAEAHIAGFTIYNDVSARDVQFKEMEMMLGPAKGKNFEGSNIMGPCMVTPDELDYNNLRMTARVNGDVVVDDHSSAMHYKFPEIIEWISEEEVLYPGDFIASGTCDHGTCMMSTLKRYLEVGDVVEMEMEGIGTIRNEVVQSEN